MRRSIDRGRRRNAGARLGCALASVMPFASAWAAWDTFSDIRMGFEANDNPRLGQRQGARPQDILDLQDHTAVRALMDARFRLSNFGERGEMFVQPRIRFDTYSDEADKDLERRDAYLYSRGIHRWRRGEIGATANFERESIISSEIIESGLADIQGDISAPPVGTDTGELVLLNEHRNRVIISPYVGFDVSERSNIGLQARYLDVTYSGPQFRGRSDISETVFGTSVSRTIDGRSGVSARMYISDFTAAVTENDTRTVGVEGSIARDLNPIWSFDLAAGVERSAFTFLAVNGDIVDNAAANFTFGLGFDKNSEIATLSFVLRRATDPSATGFLTERDEVRIFYRRRMSLRLTATLAARAVQTRALDDSERVSGRKIARAGVALEWALGPAWSLNLAYDAISQTFTDQLRADGTANVFQVSFSYRGVSGRAQ